jgi:hypothetical protein
LNGPDDRANSPGPRRLGKAAFNRGLAALAVAVGGYLLGFMVPLLVNSTDPLRSGRFMFMPIGGIASLFLAVIAIQIGLRTRRFAAGLPALRRERLSSFLDVEGELRLAGWGIALGAASIVANPLIGFVVIAIIR